LAEHPIQFGNYRWSWTGPAFVGGDIDEDGFLNDVNPRQVYVALALENVVLYRFIQGTYLAATREVWTDVIYSNSVRVSMASFIAAIFMNFNLLILTSITLLGAIQLIPMLLPDFLLPYNSNSGVLCLLAFLVSKFLLFCFLLFDLGTIFDCHNLGSRGCVAPLFMWKDPQLDKCWTF